MARYKIKSIEKVNPPKGATSKRWYKFIIENDKNTMINLRSGSEKEIRKIASEAVKRLNEKYLTHINFKFHKPANEISISSYL